MEFSALIVCSLIDFGSPNWIWFSCLITGRSFWILQMLFWIGGVEIRLVYGQSRCNAVSIQSWSIQFQVMRLRIMDWVNWMCSCNSRYLFLTFRRGHPLILRESEILLQFARFPLDMHHRIVSWCINIGYILRVRLFCR